MSQKSVFVRIKSELQITLHYFCGCQLKQKFRPLLVVGKVHLIITNAS